MRTTIRSVALATAAIATLVACSGDATSVTQAVTPPATGPVAPPAPARPGVVYDRVSASVFPGSSRFVLYGDSTFALQYGPVLFEYKGRFTRKDSALTFSWDGSSVAGLWGATGVLKDNTLTVTFNIVMTASDFEDGTFKAWPP
ncbi:MAG: hypothetical protein H0W68_07525 [Gemmatimonadaceae bacterium]|nr:hypothetical protein [Gemmatimonadaceae bacterium]